MIKTLSITTDTLIAIEASGKLTKEDYQEHIIPLIEKGKETGKKLRFLFYFGPSFESFTAGAAWEDLKIDIQNFYAFEKIAVVSDKTYIRNLIKVFAPLMPCNVETFKNDQLDQAKKWISSDTFALEHTLNKKSGVLTLHVHAPLSSELFSTVKRTIDPWIEDNGKLHGLVIHAKSFPGWKNLGSMFSHFEFVKNHHKKIDRVALAIDGSMAELSPSLAKHFVDAQIKQFDYSDLYKAQTWAQQV